MASCAQMLLVPFLLCSLCGAGETTQAAGAQAESVASVLDACARAHGGPALAGVSSERRTGTLLRGTSGRVPFEILSKSPRKWLWVQTFAWGDRVAFGSNGDEAWIQDSSGTAPMPAQQRLDLQLLLDAQSPLMLHELFPQMEITGSEKVGDHHIVRVSARSSEGIGTELVFDRDSGLLLSAGGIRFEDYREVAGVRRPFRVLLGSAQGEEHMELRMDFTEVQTNVDLGSTSFETPASILPAVAAPLYTRRTQVSVEVRDLDACAGEYQHPSKPGLKFTITRQGNHLMFQSTGQKTIEIKPQSATHYYIEFLNLEFHFVKDETGVVTDLEIVKAGRTLKAPKIG